MIVKIESIAKICELQQEIKDWADATFGFDGIASTLASLCHLSEEVEELKEAVVNGSQHQLALEYADCLSILFHTALSHGIDFGILISAVQEKLEINKRRKWGNPDKRGVVHHIKE